MRTLLLLDPDQARGHAMRLTLEALGYRVTVGHDVADAEARLREGPIDLIFVDQFLGGGMSAFADLIRRVSDPVPFVMLSSSQTAPALSARLGARALLLRPFSKAEVIEALTIVIGPNEVGDISTRRITTVAG